MESGYEPHDTRELHDRMSELQSEMFRLEVSNKKLNTINNSTAGLNGSSSGLSHLNSGDSTSIDSSVSSSSNGSILLSTQRLRSMSSTDSEASVASQPS